LRERLVARIQRGRADAIGPARTSASVTVEITIDARRIPQREKPL
jgi:hypothetical protein